MFCPCWVPSEQKKGIVKFRYAAVGQSDADEHGDIEVTCLRGVESNILFKTDEKEELSLIQTENWGFACS